MNNRIASILDYSFPFLDPAVWDQSRNLYAFQKDFILRLLNTMYETYGLKQPKTWVEDIVILGSLTTSKWLLSSDMDVHIRVNLDAFMASNMPGFTKEQAFEKLDLTRKEFDRAKILAPMTQHPIEFYFESLDFKPSNIELVGVYSILQGKWLKEPITFEADLDFEESKKDVVAQAEAIAEELDSSLGKIKRDIQRVEELENVIKAWGRDKQQLFYQKVENKLKAIEEEITKDLKIKQDLVDARHAEQNATSETEIKFKWLARFGFFGILSNLKTLLEQTGGEVTTQELPLIEKIISEGTIKEAGNLGHAYWIDPRGKIYTVRPNESKDLYTHSDWISDNLELLKKQYSINPDDAYDQMLTDGWVRIGDSGSSSSGYGITVANLDFIPKSVDNALAQFYTGGELAVAEDFDSRRAVFVADPFPNLQKAVNKALSQKRMGKKAARIIKMWLDPSGKEYLLPESLHHGDWIKQNRDLLHKYGIEFKGIDTWDEMLQKGWTRILTYPSGTLGIEVADRENIPSYLDDFIAKYYSPGQRIQLADEGDSRKIDINDPFPSLEKALNKENRNPIWGSLKEAFLKEAFEKETDTLLIDFDSTLAEEHKDGSIGEPLPNAKESLDKLKNLGYDIEIYSVRANDEKGLDDIKEWLDKYTIPYDSIFQGEKPKGLIIDDRAIKMTTWDDVLKQVEKAQKKASLFVVSRTENVVWISPDSEVFPIEQSHIGWIKNHLDILKQYGIEPLSTELDEDELHDIWDRMIRDGWVRLTDDFKEFIVDLYDMRRIPASVENIVLKENPNELRIEDISNYIILSKEEYSQGLQKAVNRKLIDRTVNASFDLPTIDPKLFKRTEPYALFIGTSNYGKAGMFDMFNVYGQHPMITEHNQLPTVGLDTLVKENIPIIGKEPRAGDKQPAQDISSLFKQASLMQAYQKASRGGKRAAFSKLDIVAQTKKVKQGDYSCLMALVPHDLAQEIVEWGVRNVPDDVLYLDEDGKLGRELESHITIKYGLLTNDAKYVRRSFNHEKPFHAKLGKVRHFQPPELPFDVLTVEVISQDLQKANKMVCDKFDCAKGLVSDEYKPHITIAYVKRDKAHEYVGFDGFKDKEVELDTVIFSPHKGNRTYFSMSNDKESSFILEQMNKFSSMDIGYWVDPNGRAYSVHGEGIIHNEWVLQNLEMLQDRYGLTIPSELFQESLDYWTAMEGDNVEDVQMPSSHEVWKQMIQTGWVRVGDSDEGIGLEVNDLRHIPSFMDNILAEDLRDGLMVRVEDINHVTVSVQYPFKSLQQAVNQALSHPDKVASVNKKAYEEFTGQAWRGHSMGGYPQGTTAADAVNYEAKELGNENNINPDVMPYLKNYPASNLIWVTKTKEDAQKYGDPQPIDLGPNAVIIGHDEEGGYLVLKGFDINKRADFLPSLFQAPDNEWQFQHGGPDKEIALNPDSVSDETTWYAPCTEGKPRTKEVWRQFMSMFKNPFSKKEELTVDSEYDPVMDEKEKEEMGLDQTQLEYSKGFYDPKKHDFPHNTTWDSLTQDGEPSKPTSVTYSPQISNEDNLDQNSPGGYPRRFMGKPKGEWFSNEGEVNEFLINMLKNKEAAKVPDEVEFYTSSYNSLSNEDKKMVNKLSYSGGGGFRDFVSEYDMQMVISKANGVIIGWSAYGQSVYKRKGAIVFVFIDKNYRGQGLGQQLFNTAVSEAKNAGFISVETWPTNEFDSQEFMKKRKEDVKQQGLKYKIESIIDSMTIDITAITRQYALYIGGRLAIRTLTRLKSLQIAKERFPEDYARGNYEIKREDFKVSSLDITAAYNHAYWLAPDGKVFTVRGSTGHETSPKTTHWNWVNENKEMLARDYGIVPTEKHKGYGESVETTDLFNAGWIRVGDGYDADWGITVPDFHHIPSTLDNLLSQFASDGDKISLEDTGYKNFVRFEWPVKSIQQTVLQELRQPVMAKKAEQVIRLNKPAGEEFRVFKNPSPNQAEQLFNNSKERVIRAVGDGKDVYMWDAYDMEHYSVMELLGILDAHGGEMTITGPRQARDIASRFYANKKTAMGFGMWMSPDGTIIDVGSHPDFAFDNAKELGLKNIPAEITDENAGEVYASLMEQMFEKGWVRLRLMSRELDIELYDLQAIPDMINNFIIEHPTETLRVANAWGDDVTVDYESAIEDGIQKAVNLVDQELTPVAKQASVENMNGIQVLINPTFNEVLGLWKRSSSKHLRLLTNNTTGDKYLWDAYFATHDDIQKEFIGSSDIFQKDDLDNLPVIRSIFNRSSVKQAGEQSASVPDYLINEWKTEQINNDTDEEPYVNHDQRDYPYGMHDSPENTMSGVSWPKDNQPYVVRLDQLDNPAYRDNPFNMTEYWVTYYNSMPMSDGIEQMNDD